ncbi:uncharacterized protein MONBRDRAFT_33699 [Monosiga brevicollis MX1]|uniref:CDK5RAP1-like protein n=1 Tax=Monosiga brevicollis TaxID=81824 RepID=A9V6X7_MONBE|nr:uncharacterized protein MONBRDRAFT_33699 [Monosiga brevicollis MX1]EDQ86621.1 predicted protein [Monosiga brevicollis MX1]|eukprot:XP_001748457.1 hypothetical protein [Monosiga brevicollis MX1]
MEMVSRMAMASFAAKSLRMRAPSAGLVTRLQQHALRQPARAAAGLSPMILNTTAPLGVHQRNHGTARKRKVAADGPGFEDFLRQSSTPLADDKADPDKYRPRDAPYAPIDEQSLLGRKVHIEAYGCQMNVSDAEIAWSILKNAGCVRCDTAEEADVTLLVTCAIRENAENKIWSRLNQLKAHKRRLGRTRNFQIGVLGCMAERLKHKLLEQEKAIDLVAGPDAYRDLPRMLMDSAQGQAQVNVLLSLDETYADITPVRTNPNSPAAFVSIQRGCANNCSYCIVPFTRGRERSRQIETIVEEVAHLSRQGVKEVTLLGQNVNSYRDLTGIDDVRNEPVVSMAKGFGTIYKPRRGGRGFGELLRAVAEVDPTMRIRFTSPHPKDFPDDVLEAIATTPNICKQIHIPAQSGSTRMLELMRRNHTREAYLDLVQHMRQVIPGVALSSDFIAGFCGETEADHEDTRSLIEMVDYDMAFLFAYSMRAKTHAYHRMQDDVPEDVKKRRLEEIRDQFYGGATLKNQRRIGSLQLVLVEKRSRRNQDEWSGRTDGNIRAVFTDAEVPDVQGLLRRANVGEYVVVQIEGATAMTLRGRPLAIVEQPNLSVLESFGVTALMPFGRKSSARRSRRNEDITQEPDEGWIHDDNALMLGDGFFYSYPVEFLGSVEIPKSMNEVALGSRTQIVRYLMNRLMVETKRLKKAGKPPKGFDEFVNGPITSAEVPVSFGIAADGMVVVLNTPNQRPDEQPPLLFYHAMRMISIATGGDQDTYELVSYVAKDASGKRSCFIFNCGDDADDVLTTLGQSFLLAQELALKKRERPKTDSVKKEYLDMVPESDEAEEHVYGDASVTSAMANAIQEQPAYDVATPAIAEQPSYDVAIGAAPVLPDEVVYDNPLSAVPTPGRVITSPSYETARNDMPSEPLYDTATTKIVKALNKRDSIRRSMRASMKQSTKRESRKVKKNTPPAEELSKEEVQLRKAEQEEMARPSWICISETAKEEASGTDLASLLSQFKQQAIQDDSDEGEE